MLHLTLELEQILMSGKVDFESLEKYALSQDEPKIASGQQEMLENLINEFI